MLTLNVKEHTKDGDTEHIIEVEEVYTRWEHDAEPTTNPSIPHMVVVGVDVKETHHEFVEGYVYVMNTNGKTVASYILGERMVTAFSH